MHILSLLLASAAALATPTQASAIEAHFKPLEYLVGHCWRARFKNGQEDVQCYRSLYAGKLLQSTHVVEGSQPRYEGTSIFSWDAANKRVRYHYFTSTGAVSEGYFDNRAEGIVIPERHVGDDGKVTELETRYERDGPDAYKVVTREKTAQGWVERWTLRYQREPGARMP